ncbi:MAG: hypothetical protein R3E42_05540 [Burkholderiaceae bacterium]
MGIDWHKAFSGEIDHTSVERQAAIILLYGLFDRDFYLSSYPDIAETGTEPLLLYISYGDKEGRWPNAHFDPGTYRTHFADGALDSITSPITMP